MAEKKDEKKEKEEHEDRVHFIEDLEKRKNASGPLTTMAVGEESGGGGW